MKNKGAQGESESTYLWRSPSNLYHLGRARSNQKFSRLCVDQLHLARRTREQYLGPWLPEGARVELAEVNGQPGLIIRVNDRAYRVMTIEVEAQQIRAIRIIANPEKLACV